jgi:16S rRNA (guanine527-N7)-methyltransferase
MPGSRQPHGSREGDGPEALRRVLPVSRETERRLERYAALLAEWQARINLVSPKTLRSLWHRHIADSAQLVPLAPCARVWADLGSGAGLPGIVIALCLADVPGVLVHLIESNGKKAAFLRTAVRETGAPARVHDGRVEAVLPGIGPVQAVTARALAPLSELIELAAPKLEQGTIGLFPKGRGVEKELRDARRSWRLEVDLAPSKTEPDGRIVVVRSARPVPGVAGS